MSSGNIYVTGDTHGDNIQRFSYRRNKGLKTLTNDDVMVVVGDVALYWNEKWNKTTEYQLKFLASKPWTTLLVRGNHDNFDMWSECKPVKVGYKNLPHSIELVAGDLREATFNGVSYPSVLLVRDSAVLRICGKTCLVISGGQSHDADFLLNPADPQYREKKKQYDSHHTWYRIIGKTWWPDEDIDIEKARAVIDDNNLMNSQSWVDAFTYDIIPPHYDYIFTHDCPARMHQIYKRPGAIGREIPTDAEDYLEYLRKTLNYGTWVHGHLHSEWFSYGADYKSQYCFETDPPNIRHWWENIDKHQNVCVYHNIYSMTAVDDRLAEERREKIEYSKR